MVPASPIKSIKVSEAVVGKSNANYSKFGSNAKEPMNVLLAEKWDDENVNPKGWWMS